MGNTLWFITILKEKPWLGVIIGLLFLSVMFLSKNLVVYLYMKNQEKKMALEEAENMARSDSHVISSDSEKS